MGRALWSWFAPLFLAAACAAPPRDANAVPLVVTLDDGVADSQVVPVEVNGRAAWLALDTGSELSFLFRGPGDPEFLESAGAVWIGDECLWLPAYGDDGIGVEWFDGKPILGVLGLDFFLPRGEIDYPGGRVVAYRSGPVPNARDLPGLPLRVADGVARVTVAIDGGELELAFDTGAHDTILLGVDAQPGDEEMAVQTADGAVALVFAGRATVTLPGEPPRSVPVMRAQEIPYLAWLVDELDLDGLLGLTSIGFRRVVFDGDRLRLGPRADHSARFSRR